MFVLISSSDYKYTGLKIVPGKVSMKATKLKNLTDTHTHITHAHG